MQRHGSGGSAAIRFRVAGVVLVLAHLLLVSWLTLRPLDVMWVTAANLEPLAGIKAHLELGPVEAARHIGGGLLLLAPLGVLLPMASGRLAVSPWASLARTVAAGALLSLGIELLQTGVPGQVVDIDSLLLNTTGVALAHLAVVPAGRARLRRRLLRTRGGTALRGQGREVRRGAMLRDEGSQGATPTIPRVGIAP
ncbi:VanZ family protein [Streptomyces pristinaespiralis]|uniref:Membrane protein n=1 Tax=Streptomyces pristinaespiralis TaxID=38300 RepID=A0A0M3QIC8_STRPR|nr:VanZ family protein [Streptomyces pristinaespiralis]ALC21279.1 membrane protein [Streptomyces pristinaespiralis]QMU15982.1 VanZ family protein [Streptomyces pristinaespiralis]